jgi:predicted membrane protein
MALGSVTLVIPEDVGVRVDKSTFLTDFTRPGFVKRDDRYYSRNWDQAERKLTVDLRGAFGTVNVRWAAATAVTP